MGSEMCIRDRYYTIPAILNDRVFGKSSELGVKRKSFLIFLAVLFFIIETYVLLSLFPEGTIFQNFLQIYVVNLCLHILFYGIVMAVRSPQKIRYLLSKMNMN